MPQKACERCIFTPPYAFFLKWPKIEQFYVILKMGKMGHFKKFEHKNSNKDGFIKLIISAQKWLHVQEDDLSIPNISLVSSHR